jgi:hypothetical protein
MNLPGWWYRENAPGYLDIAYRQSSRAWYPPFSERTAPADDDYRFTQQHGLTRMGEAQSVLDEIFYSVSIGNGYLKPAQQRSYQPAKMRKYG